MSVDPERWPALHPFLFGLFPVLFFFSQNAGQLDYGDMMIPTLFAVGLAAFCLTVGRVVYRSWRKGAIVASLAVVLFFSYGHIWNLISKATVFGIKTRHDYLLPLWAGLFVAGAYIVFRTQRELRGVTGFLNVASVAVVAMSLVQITFHEVATGKGGETTQLRETFEGDSLRPSVDVLPNIYYIVPDGYTSSETLERVFGHDNSGFESFLERKGFFVASQSQSNYVASFLSLASSMNMRYLNELSAELGTSKDRSIPYKMIKESEVVGQLSQVGYKYIHFKSGWGPTDSNKNADKNISCGFWWESEIYNTLVGTTILAPFKQYLPQTESISSLGCVFGELESLDERFESPVFAFAHIIAPHPPLGMGGPEENSWEDKSLYLDRLRIVNQGLESVIETIIDESQRPAVVIVQGDHGTLATTSYPDPLSGPAEVTIKERMGILNAYHLPGKCGGQLHDSISPVNSFRVVLNCYFDAERELLPDRSYLSSYDQPYQFEEVTSSAKWGPVEQDSTVREASN